MKVAITLGLCASWLLSQSQAQTDRACPGSTAADGVIFSAHEDAIVEYFPGFPDCPQPAETDPDYVSASKMQ